MAKVKVIKNFIGRPEEVAQNKGEVPADIAADMKKRGKELSKDEAASFDALIVRGSSIEVTEKRAMELAGKGLVEYKGITPETVQEEEQAKRDAEVKAQADEDAANEKLQASLTEEKNKNAGPAKAPAKK